MTGGDVDGSLTPNPVPGEVQSVEPPAPAAPDGPPVITADAYATPALLAAQAKIDALFPGATDRAVATRNRSVAADHQVTYQRKDSLAKRQRIVELVQGGSTIKDALAVVGITEKSHEYYKRTDPVYKANISIARRQNQKLQPTWEGDSISFSETFFHHEYPTPAFHYELKRILKYASPGTITLVNVFPNSAKTAVIEDYINETLAQDPNHRFVIASKAQNHARKLLSTVKDRMTNITRYPEYIGRFGPFYVENMERSGKPWTSDYIKVAQFDSGQRDYNVQVMGWSGQILGSRVDTIILDDIQTGDNLNQVDEMLRKFRQDFYTRLKEGRIIIIGNRIANGDFYEKLLELDIVEPENHIDLPAVDENGNSLWPERWPLEDPVNEHGKVTGIGLNRMRKMVGEKIWWTTYQQKPQLAGNATFTEEITESAKDWNLKVGSLTPGMPTILSIDPGLDPGTTAIACVQYSADQINVIDCEQHSTFSQQEQIIDLIESYALRYHPQHVVIETVAYQRALEKDDRLQALGKKYGFLTVKHDTGRNKLDPVMGIAAMASSFIREEIHIAWQGELSAVRMEPLITDLRAWRPGIPTRLLKQDLPMALWFAWKFLMEQRHAMGVGGWSRGGLPWQRAAAPDLAPRHLKVAS